MSRKLLRGRILSFKSRPLGADDHDSYVYHEDGAVLIDGTMIAAMGEYDEVAKKAPDARIIDHRPHLITPGFIDAHNHMPQMQVIGSYGTQLLDWLKTYTFPAEQAMADETRARHMARA